MNSTSSLARRLRGRGAGLLLGACALLLASLQALAAENAMPRPPELERDVTGLPMIEKLAGIMYGDGKLG